MVADAPLMVADGLVTAVDMVAADLDTAAEHLTRSPVEHLTVDLAVADTPADSAVDTWVAAAVMVVAVTGKPVRFDQ